VLLQEVHQHLGVGLGGEDVALLHEPLPQRLVVLDDAVVHHRYPPLAVQEGMGVHL
jgi:hypothetical protein